MRIEGRIAFQRLAASLLAVRAAVTETSEAIARVN